MDSSRYFILYGLFKHARAFYTIAQPSSRRSDTIAAACGHSRTGVVAAGRHINNFCTLKSIFNFHSISTPFSNFDWCLNTSLTCYFKQSVNQVPKCRIEFSRFRTPKTIINTMFLSYFLPFSENYTFLCFPHVIFHFLRSPNSQPVKSQNLY